ncbi:hypothetical protein CAPTEDRAFT_173432 [Capitella teleta]|uniref:Spt20-like SEP domain-containing protein n=1 Tax=Capitella teleta TaxID=283909 RepID=R7TSP1_CAPTE|nr:hypothetical protein CAPTEDRAFT_173432 [Capitella teleta]|eukprot:ELT94045.1 hypothetical protein CAPTEDRAFT_173432 [Capitella teleta]
MLKPNSYLLDKLVKKERMNTLVVNLYPGNEGFSLMLRGKGGSESETIRLPYEESEILDAIDEEQLPPLIVDILDKAQVNVFYSGCVVAEIRDHRRGATPGYDTRYVLLHPTPQSLHCDMNALMLNDPCSTWTQDDKHLLESQLLLRTQAPLCLDPSPSVSLVANKLNYVRSRFNTHSLRRAVKKYSQVSINRKRRMLMSRAPKHLFLHDFIQRRKNKADSSLPPVNLKVSKTDSVNDPATQSVDMWQQREVHLSVPQAIDVPKYAKVIERPKPSRDNSLIVVEELTFETERSPGGKVNYSRLLIFQRLSDEFYLGELYVDRDYVEAASKGSTCKSVTHEYAAAS